MKDVGGDPLMMMIRQMPQRPGMLQRHDPVFALRVRRWPATAVRLNLSFDRTGALVSVGKDGGMDGDHHRGRASAALAA